MVQMLRAVVATRSSVSDAAGGDPRGAYLLLASCRGTRMTDAYGADLDHRCGAGVQARRDARRRDADDGGPVAQAGLRGGGRSRAPVTGRTSRTVLRRRGRDASATRGRPMSCSRINAPAEDELDQMKPGATLVALLAPRLKPDIVDVLAKRPITALSMDAVPRISRAQSLDVLSSMANIAGYRAVIEAAHEFGRFFTGQVTAAGKVPPAKVLVVGAGVAGLSAIGAAGSLGAIVRATDPRPEVADQVRSLGGEYLSIESPEVEVQRHGLRQGDGRGLQGARDEALRRAVRGRRHRHHHRADPGQARAAADHRGDGGGDEARLGDRGHGRGQRRQRRGRRGRREDRHRRTASRSSATPTWPAGCPPRRASSTAPTWST